MKKESTDFTQLFEEYPDIVTVPQLWEMLGVCKANACQLLNSGQIAVAAHYQTDFFHSVPPKK